MPMGTVTQEWPVANVIPATGDFTCWTLDANGAWVIADGILIPEMEGPADIGLKASAPLSTIILSATFKMRFTFISPTGQKTVKVTSEWVPISNNQTYTDSKTLTVTEYGLWQCIVEVLRRKLLMSDFEVTSTWGPFAIANVIEPTNGNGDGNGGGLTDSQKALLIAGAVGIGALVLMRRE